MDEIQDINLEVPAIQETNTVFQGPISPADQATLLGFLTKAGGLAVYGFASGGNPSIADSTEVVINNTLGFEQGMSYASSLFTISVAGKYLVIANIGWDNHAGYHEGRIKKNGTTAYYDYFYSDPQATLTVVLMDLVAGDTIGVYGYQTTAASCHTPNGTWLGLMKI